MDQRMATCMLLIGASEPCPFRVPNTAFVSILTSNAALASDSIAVKVDPARVAELFADQSMVLRSCLLKLPERHLMTCAMAPNGTVPIGEMNPMHHCRFDDYK